MKGDVGPGNFSLCLGRPRTAVTVAQGQVCFAKEDKATIPRAKAILGIHEVGAGKGSRMTSPIPHIMSLLVPQGK